MPRHVISDVHEWMNEVPTVPIWHPANPQPWERARPMIAGKEDPVELHSSLRW